MSKPPLWEVMRRAYDTSPPAPADADNDWTDRHGYAAEIRALRDWLVPVDENGDPIGYLTCAQVEDRLWIRSILTAEADRAERGEVERG
jgi:hypothetical protein